jgi:hypothetical protein
MVFHTADLAGLKLVFARDSGEVGVKAFGKRIGNYC